MNLFLIIGVASTLTLALATENLPSNKWPSNYNPYFSKAFGDIYRNAEVRIYVWLKT